MVRWLQTIVIFASSAVILTGCNSSSQTFLGVEETLAANQDLKPYSIESNSGIVVYKDNGVYDSTGMGTSFNEVHIEDIDFEMDYPRDPIGY